MSTKKDYPPLTPPKQRRVSKLLWREFNFAARTPGAYGQRISASIHYSGVVLGSGENSVKTHPFQKEYGNHEEAIHLHAEVAAILQATRVYGNLEDSVMVVARAKRSGPSKSFVYGLAKPCKGCQRAIAAAGIKEVYFTCDGDMEWDSL